MLWIFSSPDSRYPACNGRATLPPSPPKTPYRTEMRRRPSKKRGGGSKTLRIHTHAHTRSDPLRRTRDSWALGIKGLMDPLSLSLLSLSLSLTVSLSWASHGPFTAGHFSSLWDSSDLIKASSRVDSHSRFHPASRRHAWISRMGTEDREEKGVPLRCHLTASPISHFVAIKRVSASQVSMYIRTYIITVHRFEAQRQRGRTQYTPPPRALGPYTRR